VAPSFDNIIVNGYNAYEGKAPYLVGLRLNNGAVGAGSIIGNTWVLTAAHCLTTDSVEINYGSNRAWNGQLKINVGKDNFIRHPGFPNTPGNDIGLIRTPHVNFNNLINKVALPKISQKSERFENWWTVACGWGGMANGNLADWMQCMDVQVISNSECARSYGSVANTDMCTRATDGKSVCGGDSGGALVTHDNPMQIGVITFASVGCKSGPSGYTRINYGSNRAWNGQLKINVGKDNFIRHPGYPNTAGHDIGLIRTPYVNFNNLINKVALPKFSQKSERFENWWTVACGWGGMANGKLADWMQCMDVQVISNSECARSYGSVASTDMCTRATDGKSVCGGDSGGALVTHDNPMQIGVITFASSGCKSGPSGYTRVTDHLDWIKENSGI
ncbi:hypothetical protein KR018_008897, partial [Drosophila ironensis]